MTARNPNPARVTDQLWAFWAGFDVLEPTVLLGGIATEKPGYHSWASRLPRSDYSLRDLADDRAGPGDKAAAIDLTMSAAAMKVYTKRLDVAARASDERLYVAGHPILREFIGTKDGKTVYCYVLTGGRPLGVGADAGPDPGRDDSHLWHLHLSVIRRFTDHPELAVRLLSVLAGESVTQWRARPKTITSGGEMQQSEKLTAKTSNPNRTVGNVLADLSNLRDWWISPAGTAGLVTTPAPNSPAAALLVMARDWMSESTRQRLRDEAILAAVQGQRASADIIAQVDLRASQLAEAIGQMRAQIAVELAPLLVQAIGAELARTVPADALADAQETALRRVLGSLDGQPQ